MLAPSATLSARVRLRDERGLAMLYITHDLAAVGKIATRIAVMYAGRVVEQCPASQILSSPSHPYTRGLVASTPDHLRIRRLTPMAGISAGVGERPAGCAFEPRCPQRVDRCVTELPSLIETAPGHLTRCFEWASTPALDWSSAEPASASAAAFVADRATVLEVQHLSAEYRSHGDQNQVVRDVSFTVAEGACVALVGESGSGKTTIARAIVGLHPPSDGQVLVRGRALAGRARDRSVEDRRRIAIVFQNPTEALNPRQTVVSTVSRPAQVLRRLDRKAAEAETRLLLEAVRLPARTAERYPGELSGGERQRVAIARALAGQPDVLICDEVTSSLDVSVQAVVLDLLRDLREQLGIAITFITHDLGVVAAVAERVLILEAGSICEEGSTAEVLNSPRHEYTQRLLEAAPSLSSTISTWNGSRVQPAEPTASSELNPQN